MLESIELINFRLHQRLKITFSPQITTLVGKSYSGKSTVIRALRWVGLNKPAGTSVIRWGAKQAKVILKIDGHTIMRARSKTVNRYTLDGHVYTAFGGNVPKPIAQLLAVSEMNFQGQHSLPFWFSDTAGAVARELNRIVNLGVIDTTLRNLAHTITTVRTTATVVKERLAAAKATKRRLAFVATMAEDWKEVQLLQAAYGAEQQRLVELDRLIAGCKVAKAKIEQSRPPAIIGVDRAFARYKGALSAYEQLADMIPEIKQARARAAQAKANAATLHNKLHKLAKGRCPLCGRKGI